MIRPALFVAGVAIASGADLQPDTDLFILHLVAGVALIVAGLWGAKA